jgi:enoyl-[acyl-carrier protein] reductase III
MVDFQGRRALVTGASRGLGAELARSLARAGAHVFLNYRKNELAAEAVRLSIEADGGSAALLPANLIEPKEIRSMFAEISETGGLDFLIHNAALGSFKKVTSLRTNQWDLTLDVNARAFLICAQEALPRMQGGGRIVAVSSLGSTRVVPSYGAIGVSKAALESLVRYLAVELAPQGIHVNGVTAGLLEGSESVRSHPFYDDLIRQARKRSPNGQLCTPEEIARVVLFLCSPLSDGLQGQMIVADGGSSLVV